MSAIRWVSIYILLFSLALGVKAQQSKTIASRISSTGWAPYVLSDKFTKEEQDIINNAIDYFEKSVGCINFVKVSQADSQVTLYINPISKRAKTNLGTFNNFTQTIDLWTKTGEDKLYKTVLHELAHAVGMSGHIFPKRLSSRSQLTPLIVDESKPFLYRRDVKYLRKLVCKE